MTRVPLCPAERWIPRLRLAGNTGSHRNRPATQQDDGPTGRRRAGLVARLHHLFWPKLLLRCHTAAPHRRDQPHVAPIGGLSMLLNFMVVNIVYKLAPVSNADSRFP
jgi:hypothetical protein